MRKFLVSATTVAISVGVVAAVTRAGGAETQADQVTGVGNPISPEHHEIKVVYESDLATVGLYKAEGPQSDCVDIVLPDGSEAYGCFDSATIADGHGFIRLQETASDPGLLIGLAGGVVEGVSVDGADVQMLGPVWVTSIDPNAKSFELTLSDGRVVTNEFPPLPLAGG